jgi:hypothetical protein
MTTKRTYPRLFDDGHDALLLLDDIPYMIPFVNDAMLGKSLNAIWLMDCMLEAAGRDGLLLDYGPRRGARGRLGLEDPG